MRSYTPCVIFDHELPKYRDHLLRLDQSSRSLRFGLLASDDMIISHVSNIRLGTSTVIRAIHDDNLNIIAAAEIAICGETAEIALSVDKELRGKGVGKQLFMNAMVYLRTKGVKTVMMLFQRKNSTMMRIASREGMELQYYGSEVEAVKQIQKGNIIDQYSDIIMSNHGRMEYYWLVISQHAKFGSVIGVNSVT